MNVYKTKLNFSRFPKHIVFIIIGFIQLYPLAWLAFFSLKNNDQIFLGNIAGFPNPLVWKNYTTIIVNGQIFRYLFNSILVTGSTLVISTLLIAMSSYAVIRMRWRFQKVAFLYILLGLTIPLQATLLPVFKILQNINIINTYLALIVPYTAFAIPLGVSIMSGVLYTIPNEIEEAACIDGCNIYNMFFRIVFPLLKGGLVTISIFTFLSCWNELMFSMTFISKQQYKTLTTGVMSLMGKYSTDWGVIGAGLFITVIPILIFYSILGKKIQVSLMAGAVKG
ncbi:MAG: carbohydrate ABC transporter permease [Ruminiclostridium sp.]